MDKLPIRITLDESFFLEEELCGYKVTAQSKQLWAVILDLMVTFDSVCKEYGIHYSLDSGTLLGAVRHKGFIPWDADVIMFRSEYEKLCKIAPQAFKAPYFWQTNDTDPGSLRRHGQLRNSMTTCILTNETENGKPFFSYNQGAFLDVFILDEIPDDADELKGFRNDLQQWVNLLWDFKEYYAGSGETLWMREAQRQAYEQFEKTVSRYNGTGNKRVGNIALKPQRDEAIFFSKEVYEDLVDYTFEGFSFPAPRNYETILKAHYGDWHKYVIGGDDHGTMIMDLTNPYTLYLEKHAKENKEELRIDVEHPILKLYKHRDLLLKQRDVAWSDIKKLESHKDNLLQEIRNRDSVIVNLQNDNIRLKNKVKKKRKTNIILLILSVLLFLIALLQFLI